MVTHSIRRGRPKTFDANAALDQAVLLFWRQGFEGTSVSDLTAAIGVTAPTLYAAFGSKEALYSKALDRYRSEYGINRRIEEFIAEPSAFVAFRNYFKASAKALSDVETPPGCLVTSANLLASPENVQALKATAELRFEALEMFRKKLEAARDGGELPPDVDPRHLATFFAAFAQGLAGQSCDGADATALNASVDIVMMAWPTGSGVR